jgi:putative DNA primase/helicase
MPRTKTKIAENSINPVLDWINSKKPKAGFSGLQKLCDAVVCHDDYDNEFKEELIIKWLVSAYASVAQKDDAGFCNRSVLVLHGEQGIGKTTFLRNLCGRGWGGDLKWLSEVSTPPGWKFKDYGFWMMDIGELLGITTKRGIPVYKTFLENMLNTPCRTVFAGTVNEMGFLSDITGNSRFWVIPVKKFKDTSQIDMQQVWATVAELYEKGKISLNLFREKVCRR